MSEKTSANAIVDATIVRNATFTEQLELEGRYHFECFGPDGKLKWEDDIKNLVTTAGKNDMLDKYLAGSSYNATWYLGLISSTSWSAVNAADTMSSHAGWLEAGSANAPSYSQGARPTPSWNAAAAGSKATSAVVVFSITNTGTVKGSFLTSVSTKDGTTGTLLSAGTFTQGDKVVGNGDTLNATYTLGLT